MSLLIQDIRYGFRVLLKNPVVSLIAIIALALGIGANSAIFTVVNAVMLGDLPYAAPEQLVLVWEKREGREQNVINLGNFSDWKQQNTVFSDMASFIDTRANLVGDGPPEEIPGQLVTTNLHSLLGLNAMRGRTFLPEDGKPGGPRVVVISYSLWQRRFGGGKRQGRGLQPRARARAVPRTARRRAVRAAAGRPKGEVVAPRGVRPRDLRPRPGIQPANRNRG